MARIRAIKPGFFTDHTLADLPLTARVTFAGLWTHVDDEGRAVDDARLVKAAVWPLDDRHTIKRVEADLALLAQCGRIERYASAGRRYLRVVNWDKHQVISHPRPSEIPAPDNSGTSPGSLQESSGKPLVSLQPDREGNREVEGDRDRERSAGRRRATPPPDDFQPSDELRVWASREVPQVDFEHETKLFLDHHRAKGSTFKDWSAAWRTWMRRSVGYNGAGGTGQGRADDELRAFAAREGLA